MAREFHTFWENQRYYPGPGWVPSEPSILGTGLCKADPPPWTTDGGEAFRPPALLRAGGDYLVVCGAATDAEGWEYGTSFEHIASRRPGGRGRAAVTDVVRRRRWVRREAAGEEEEELDARACASYVSPRELSEKRAALKEETDSSFKEALALVKGLLTSRSVLEGATMLAPIAAYRVRSDHLERHGAWAAELPPAAEAPALCARAAPSQAEPDDLDRLRGLRHALPYARAASGHRALRRVRLEQQAAGGGGGGGGGEASSPGRRGVNLRGLTLPSADSYRTPDASANIDAMLEVCGRDPADLLHVHFDQSPLRPVHAVLLDRAAEAVVLTIRGTNSAEDACTDCMASEVIDDEVCSCADEWASCHNGMVQAARWVLEKASPALEKAMKEYPSYRLVVTGHSLGAGVAALLTLLLDARQQRSAKENSNKACADASRADELEEGRPGEEVEGEHSIRDAGNQGEDEACADASRADELEEGKPGEEVEEEHSIRDAGNQGEDKDFKDATPTTAAARPPAALRFSRLECYVFACPCVASESISLSERAQRCVTNLVLGRDAVARLCFSSVDALIKELYARSLTRGVADAFGSVVAKLPGRADSDRAADSAAPPSDETPSSQPLLTWEQHLPIGRCLWIPDPKSDEVGLFSADPRHFGRIVLHERMFSDHRLGAYAASMARLCQAEPAPDETAPEPGDDSRV